MNKLLEISILPLLITLLSYMAGTVIQRKAKTLLCNPILIAVILVLLFLAATGIDLEVYQAGNNYLSWLLTPATVCLAISMYEQFQILRKHICVIVVGVTVGAVSSLIMILGLGLLFRYSPEIIISLLPKSVTTAIGVPLSSLAGGITPITTAAIILTGITASVLGPVLCKVFHLTDEIAQGVAYGTSGHVIGTTKAMESSKLSGAVSSLSLVVAGLLTAVVFPFVTSIS